MGQAFITSFDCFRQPLAPFTLQKSGSKKQPLTHYGTLWGAFMSVVLLGILTLIAMPKAELILSQQPLSYYQVTQQRQPDDFEFDVDMRVGFSNKNGELIPVSSYSSKYGRFVSKDK